MTTTGTGSNGDWNYYTGFGPADPWGLLNANASSLPDVNPCESKTLSSKPSWQDVEDYIDGTVNPLLMRNDDDYVYRGVNEDAAFSRIMNSPFTWEPARATTGTDASPPAGQ